MTEEIVLLNGNVYVRYHPDDEDGYLWFWSEGSDESPELRIDYQDFQEISAYLDRQVNEHT